MRILISLVIVTLAICAAACRRSSEERGHATVIGRVEHVFIEQPGLGLKARIDTGAGVSSIHANILKIEKLPDRAGERILFEIGDGKGTTRIMEREVLEWARIKGKGTKREIRRPVVVLNVCLAGKRLKGRVNLAERSHFLYPMLIGRNMLSRGGFLIDPDRKFMEHPACAGPALRESGLALR